MFWRGDACFILKCVRVCVCVCMCVYVTLSMHVLIYVWMHSGCIGESPTAHDTATIPIFMNFHVSKMCPYADQKKKFYCSWHFPLIVEGTVHQSRVNEQFVFMVGGAAFMKHWNCDTCVHLCLCCTKLFFGFSFGSRKIIFVHTKLECGLFLVSMAMLLEEVSSILTMLTGKRGRDLCLV